MTGVQTCALPIFDFVHFALKKSIILRFIEFMKITPLWNQDRLLPVEEVKKICKTKFILKPSDALGSGPAEYYKVENRRLLGFIKTDENNCKRCTRLRLTSTGTLKVCLYENGGVNLRDFLKRGFSDEAMIDIIKTKIEIKESTSYLNWKSSRIYMCSIGG